MAQNPPISAQHPDLDQEPAPAKPAKKSPLYGISRTRVISLDKGVQKTIESTVARWLKNRIEFIESLPPETQQELIDEGVVNMPTLVMPGTAPKPPPPPVPARRPEPVTGFAGARVQGVAGYGRQ